MMQDERLDLLRSIHYEIGLALEAAEVNVFLSEDRDEWKAKYLALLDDSIKHGDKMMGNVLKMLVDKR